MNAKNGFDDLLAVAARLQFVPHDIRAQLDRTGHYDEQLNREFPFVIRLFHFRAGKFTQGATWHERLELFLPLDGPCSVRMGGSIVTLQHGDLLVVDNLKLHQTLDQPRLNTRVIVTSFQPEFVYSLGSPSHDYTLLLPFYSKVESSPRVLRRQRPLAEGAHRAMARLLEGYFDTERPSLREAGTKALFLVLLYQLARHFEDAEQVQADFLKQQALSLRLRKLFDHLSAHYAERMTIEQAAQMAGLSRAQFTRVFRKAAGMSLVKYVNHLRLSHAARLLRENNRTIAEVAAATGFADQSYFDRQFRRSFGQSPSEFRTSRTPRTRAAAVNDSFVQGGGQTSKPTDN